MKALIVFSAIVAGCISCNSAKKSATPTTDAMPAAAVQATLTGTYWKLVELTGQAVKTDAQAREVFFKLTATDSTVTGNGGCNIFNGKFSTANEFTIRFSPMVSTLMACEKMDVEQQLMDVLTRADNYTINGNTLSLNKARMAPLARFEAVPGK
jgi:heat shock protein HslJ